VKRFSLSFWPAALPPLFGVLCATLIAPPLLWSDTATGLLSWWHFVSGGTWNTIPVPDPVDIARSLESAVTWWSPGQAVPLGLLTLAGLPLGMAMILLALLSSLAFGSGLALLARDLGAPAGALPWVTTVATGSWPALYAFGMFNGGEVALIAIWPWIAWAAWRLLPHPTAFSFGLPILFLAGSFAKHSFAVYGLALMGFLWLETLRRAPRRVLRWMQATLPFVFAGLLYLLGRHFLFDHGASPSDPGQVTSSFASTWGFGAIAPMLSATGLGNVMGRIFVNAGLTFEEGWNQLGWPLAVFSPLPLGGLIWLMWSPRPLERFAGLGCLVTFAVMFLLMWRGGSISLEDRHYRPAAALLLTVLGAGTAASSRRVAWGARCGVVLIVVFGCAATLQRHLNMRAAVFLSPDSASLADMPPEVLSAVKEIARRGLTDGSLIYLPDPAMGVAVNSGRLWVTDVLHRDIDWITAQSLSGRVPNLTLVLPTRMEDDGRSAALRASFVDYQPWEWTRRAQAGWDLWQAQSE
jgi:hypothetical protein